jgi:hypothetical protein
LLVGKREDGSLLLEIWKNLIKTHEVFVKFSKAVKCVFLKFFGKTPDEGSMV